MTAIAGRSTAERNPLPERMQMDMANARTIVEKSTARAAVSSCVALAVASVLCPFRAPAQSATQPVLAAAWDASEPRPSLRRLPGIALSTPTIIQTSGETAPGAVARASHTEGSATIATIAAVPQTPLSASNVANAGVSFKRPDTRDIFAWTTTAATASSPLQSVSAPTITAPASPVVGTPHASAPAQASEFRVVGVIGSDPLVPRQEPLIGQPAAQDRPVPATFIPTAIEPTDNPTALPLGDNTVAPPIATGAYTPPASSIPVAPAALTDAIPGAMPMAGSLAMAQSDIYNSATRALNGGCPYNPGDSGTPSVCGVDCGGPAASRCATWEDSRCIPWALLGPGEYVGPARPEHLSTYYLRVNDLVTLTYITSRRKEAERYRIGCGDRLQIEWLQAPSTTDPKLDREVIVQPDGTISLPLVGDVIAAGKTVKDLREEIVKGYGRFQRDPQITVTPMEVNTAIQDILNAVTSVSGSNGQTQALRVTPEGTIQAPALGSVLVQGLTLEEARAELEARYTAKFGPGLLVSPSLTERAASFVFVGGEVQAPGRYALEGPTTVMQAIALAGGWNNGGNLRQVVVFRRDENWCLKATKIDIRAPLYGQDPCPTNDVWLRDNDLVIVPKTKILCATDVINLYFTRGVYAAFPISYVYSFSTGSTVTPITMQPGP